MCVCGAVYRVADSGVGGVRQFVVESKTLLLQLYIREVVNPECSSEQPKSTRRHTGEATSKFWTQYLSV